MSFARMSWLRIHTVVRLAALVRAWSCLCISSILREKKANCSD